MINYETYDGDTYQYCSHCHADCNLEPENQVHLADCPQVTGVWPVVQQDVDLPGGFCCFGCGDEFTTDDSYYVYTPDDDEGSESILCLSCAAYKEIIDD